MVEFVLVLVSIFGLVWFGLAWLLAFGFWLLAFGFWSFFFSLFSFLFFLWEVNENGERLLGGNGWVLQEHEERKVW